MLAARNSLPWRNYFVVDTAKPSLWTPPPYSLLHKPCKLSSSQDLVVGLVWIFLDLDIFK